MSQKIQKLADESGKEISSSEIWDIFQNHFLIAKNDFSYLSHLSSTQNDVNQLELKMLMNSKEFVISG